MPNPAALGKLVDHVLPEVTDMRHVLHSSPELACAEFDTASLVRKKLGALPLRVLPAFLDTDVVAFLDGVSDGPNVTLRADMDALPLDEKTGVPYRSTRPGLMHACGHDGHTAMLIGAAIVLSDLRDSMNGSVRFVFQPGEEVVAAGKDLVAAGALLTPTPDMVLAIHGWPGSGEGMIGSKPGPLMAAADFFSITVHGKGAHGSRPHEAVDPILTAARIVDALQSLVSRTTDPLDCAVVSVCHMSAGANENIIPDRATLAGTVRTLLPETHDRMPSAMERVIKGVCDSMGATYEFQYKKTYIPTVNHATAVDLGRRATVSTLGESFWIDIEKPTMGGEDFAYYITEYPGALFLLGLGINSAPLHSPHFDFNDAALRNGILFLVSMAMEVLS